MTTSGEINAAPPDWATMDREILCPLCEYNLRGLVEPRCPECGHRFEWREILEQSQGEYTWLFEYARKRKFRSFIRTFFTSQLSRHFWNSVRPVHIPKARKLLFYWLALTILVVPPVLVFWSQPLIVYYRQLLDQRAMFFSSVQSSLGTDPELAAEVKAAGSVQAFVAQRCPLIPYRSLFRDLWADLSTQLVLLTRLVIGAMLWPWLTVASLLLFRWSLRKAKIKAVHVLRCAIYAGDSALLLAFPAAWALTRCVAIQADTRNSIDGRMIYFNLIGLLVFVVLSALLTYRLTIAYRNYLCFPHALATCAASQLIVLLTLLYLSPWGWVY